MVKGCAPKIAKLTLFILNFIIWVCSLAILGLGIWMAVQSNKFKDLFSEDNVSIVAYMMIGVGSGLFLIGFSGCQGARKESVFFLNLYFFLMLALVAVEATAGILAFVYTAQIEEYMRVGMNETISKNYGYTTSANESIDIIQRNFDCCGANDYTDYQYSRFMIEKGLAVPESCCMSTTTCGVGTPGMPNSTSDVWPKGCVEASIGTVENNIIALGAVLFSVLAVEILAMTFACCVKGGLLVLIIARCLSKGIKRQNLLGKPSKNSKKSKKTKTPKSKKQKSSKKSAKQTNNNGPAPPVEYMPPPSTATTLPATVAPYNPQDDVVVKMEYDAGPGRPTTEGQDNMGMTDMS